ncbi:MAG: glycosyltransferase, partial [Thermomicrobia bacterium]|nr:glycosyltransferase [Thermomicrobia bacterium]
MAMRVLLISAEYPPIPGGIGDYTALLAAHLASAGATVAVLTTGNGAVQHDGEVTVYERVPSWGWGSTQAICDVVRSFGPEIVHLQYQTGMYDMHPVVNFLPDRLSSRIARAERGGKPRFVTTFHDLRHPYLFPKAGFLRAFVTRHLARTSSLAIGTNGEDVTQLRRWRANAALLPIGSNIPAATVRDARAIRARYGIPAEALLLTTFGLLNRSKGIETVIDALALLRREGTDAHLLLIGAGAGVNDPTNHATALALDRQCAAAGLTAFVHRTGSLPAAEVAEALAASDLCVLPYRDGASPRRGSLLAALAEGIPVVTTPPAPGVYDGLPNLQDGEAARYVPVGDARAVADAVRAIHGDRALAHRLRAGASAYAAHVTWPAIAAQTLALYATLGVTASETMAAPVVAA